jgi:hypothetical protein
MRLRRVMPAVPVSLVALALATASPAGAVPLCTTGCAHFAETGAPQAFTVPAGVLGAIVDLEGAGGGAGWDMAGGGSSVAGAPGGSLIGTLATTPQSTLEVLVGHAGGDGTASAFGEGGFNGGGNGSYYVGESNAFGGGGGGGATDIRSGSCAGTLSCGDAARVAIAGGGGGTGGGVVTASAGGAGGGASGVDGTAADGTVGGGGGAAGGAGTGGGGGSPGAGDTGGAAAANGGAGGGGGGYYGGGGGGLSADDDGTGGGGGGGYVLDPTAADYSLVGEGAMGSIDGSAEIYWSAATALSSTVGGSVTVTAYLPPFEDGGSETFTLGSTILCNDVAVAGGEASCTTSALPIGTDDVTATLAAVAPVSFRVPGSVNLDSDLVSTPGRQAATPDARDPWDGTTEVLAISVSSSVPVPASGAGLPAGVPPVAVVLILVGAGGILATGRLRRVR